MQYGDGLLASAYNDEPLACMEDFPHEFHHLIKSLYGPEWHCVFGDTNLSTTGILAQNLRYEEGQLNHHVRTAFKFAPCRTAFKFAAVPSCHSFLCFMAECV